MKAIIGLGNPGGKYEFTRHNAGFLMVDYFAMNHNVKIKKIKHKACIGELSVNGERVLLVKPQTFMNASGACVREIISYYKLNIGDVLIIFDDISIPLGRIRARAQGSDGGHNGMKDIIYQLQSADIPRIKIGISAFRNESEDTALKDYVLDSFSKKELTVLRSIAEVVSEAIPVFLERGIGETMNRFNAVNLLEEENK